MKDYSRLDAELESLAQESALEAVKQLPNTEPERSNLADPRFPQAWYKNEKEYIAGSIGREPTEEDMETYIGFWEEAYEEFLDVY